MEWWQLLLVALVGAAAGLINTVVGSGTLITFPTLLALGATPEELQSWNAPPAPPPRRRNRKVSG